MPRGPPRPAITTTRPKPTADGSGRTQTRQVRQVRWEPAAGRLQHVFDDDLVCASVGVHPALLRGVEPFPTGELKPYDAAYVAGWVVERYQIDLVSAAKAARDAMDAELRQLCAAQVPGDTYRNLDVRADYSGQTFKHILAPIWLLTYNFGSRTFQAVMNGVTGAIQRRVSEELGEAHAAGHRDPDRGASSCCRSAAIADDAGVAAPMIDTAFPRTTRMKAAIVTGVSRGLGESLAAELLARGFAVTGIGRASADRLRGAHYTLRAMRPRRRGGDRAGARAGVPRDRRGASANRFA